MLDINALQDNLLVWGRELGFADVGISDVDLSKYEPDLKEWLAKKYHGSMQYMEQYRTLRSSPDELVPGTLSIIMVRMDYLPPNTDIRIILKNHNLGAISRYALGRDYHKLMRKRLQKFADKISAEIGPFGYRAFVDSAPVMEKPLAEKSGLGWIGKNTLLLNKSNGSYFFLGSLFTDLPLIANISESVQPKSYCGSCTACIDICPTKAIIGPRKLDATRCISYLTIENKGSIPVEFRAAIGNRIYGCDDCQVVCPWNKFAKYTQELDFYPRHGLDAPDLVEIFMWTEAMFIAKTTGSAIKRIGYNSWLRNVAIALGNAPFSERIITALEYRLQSCNAMVHEHVMWALEQQKNKQK